MDNGKGWMVVPIIKTRVLKLMTAEMECVLTSGISDSGMMTYISRRVMRWLGKPLSHIYLTCLIPEAAEMYYSHAQPWRIFCSRVLFSFCLSVCLTLTHIDKRLTHNIYIYIYIYIYILKSVYLGNRLLFKQVLLKTMEQHLLFLILFFKAPCYCSRW